MNAFLLVVAVSIMSNAGKVRCESYSESCSSVNGKMICVKKQGSGNFAGSSAGAFSAPGGGYMNSNAGVGDTNTGTFNYAQQEANVPPNFNNDGYPPGNAPPPSSSSSSSSSSGSWGGPGAGSFAGAGPGFAGAYPPFYNPVFPAPFAAYPSDQARPVAPMYPGAYAGGFAGAGPGMGPMNPMAYVANAMNGMAMGMAFGRR